MELASPPSPTLQQLQQHQLTAARRLVDFYKLTQNGLGRDKLDELFTEKDSWYRDDFVLCYRIRSQLGTPLFWEVIRELNETSVEGVQQPVQPNESRAEHTAQALNDPTRNRSASTNSHPESNGLKHALSDGNGVDETTHALLPDTSTDPNSKRRKYSSKGKSYADRFCPGPFNATGPVQCNHAQTPRKYPKYWTDACGESCLETYRLKPKVDNMRYRCVPGCNEKFKDRSELSKHMWDGLMKPGVMSCSPHIRNQMQAVNQTDASSARDGNAVPGPSIHAQDPLDMSNGDLNSINGGAVFDDLNPEALASDYGFDLGNNLFWNVDGHPMGTSLGFDGRLMDTQHTPDANTTDSNLDCPSADALTPITNPYTNQ